MVPRSTLSPMVSRAVVAGASVLVVAALYLARDVLIPITLAILVAFLLSPLVARFKRWGFSQTISVAIVGGITLLVSITLLAFVGLQLTELLDNLPSYAHNAQERFRVVSEPLQGLIAKVSQSATELTANGEVASQPATAPVAAGIPLPEPGQRYEFAMAAVATIAAPIGILAVVIVLAGAMLIQGGDLRDRVIRLIGDKQVTVTTKALDEVAERVSRYLLTQTLLNGGMGAVIAVGLMALGVPSALLWGLLWAMLRFLPYIGPWLGAILPIVTALGVFDNWTQPFLTILLLVVVELITNIVLEPWLYGSGTGLSPLAVLIAAVFWAWLWGWVGLLLATPMTVCLAVLGQYVEPLRFLHVLLGDKPGLRPSVRLYQRLLSGQEDSAREIVHEQLATRPAADVFEGMIIPALVLVDADRQRNLLEVDRVTAVHASVARIIDSIPIVESASRTKSDAVLLCFASRDTADALCNRMLHHICSSRGIDVELMDDGYFANEMAAIVAERRPAAVLVSALSEQRESFQRHALRRIAARTPDCEHIAGIWHGAEDDSELQARLGDATGAVVVTTFAAACDALRLAAAQRSSVRPREKKVAGDMPAPRGDIAVATA